MCLDRFHVLFGFYLEEIGKTCMSFFPQAQWPSLLHTQIWGNLPRTSSAKALVKQQTLITHTIFITLFKQLT